MYVMRCRQTEHTVTINEVEGIREFLRGHGLPADSNFALEPGEEFRIYPGRLALQHLPDQVQIHLQGEEAPREFKLALHRDHLLQILAEPFEGDPEILFEGTSHATIAEAILSAGHCLLTDQTELPAKHPVCGKRRFDTLATALMLAWKAGVEMCEEVTQTRLEEIHQLWKPPEATFRYAAGTLLFLAGMNGAQHAMMLRDAARPMEVER